jgi:D-beta-D-heptose 7-phosphate kinase/D-beta-D-heptose 1-phosphate adenosyltransferase
VTIPNFTKANVTIVGDVMLDRYWHGSTSRISPEAPVPVVHVRDVDAKPGGAGNVAINIAALGGRVRLMSVTGRDENARLLRSSLELMGVDCSFQQDESSPTVTKLRVISHHQQLIRLDFEEGFHALDTSYLAARLRERVSEATVIVLSDYGKGVLSPAHPFIEVAREHNKVVLVDPKQRDFGHYRGATFITPNMTEFEAAVGPCRDDEEIVAKGLRLIEQHELNGLLITRGEQGMILLQAEHAPIHLPTHAREVFDVTGAGDTVIAVLAAALAAGESLPKAMRLANLAAGIVVGKLGTASVTPPELQAALNQHEDIQTGVINRDQLANLLIRARQAGETIVMTNGCFDILHAGHVRYLERAAQLGDHLIVAVNDDFSVRRLKGVGRPINTVEQRMAVLAGLAAVDWVVPFSEDTPEQLICEVRPDYLVKGGDYRPDEVAGNLCARETRILPYLEGCSTSALIDSIIHSGVKT